MLSGRRRGEDTGAVALMAIVLMAAVLLPMTAIVVGLGLARDDRDQAQITADSAALAAAVAMRNGGTTGAAVIAAEQFVTANMVSESTVFKTCGGCVAFDQAAKTVAVTLQGVPAGSPFAGGLTVSVTSTASWALDQRACALCLDGDLTLGTGGGGTSDVQVTGDVDLADDLRPAKNFTGTLTVTSGTLGLEAGGSINAGATLVGAQTQINVIGDPSGGTPATDSADIQGLISAAVPPVGSSSPVACTPPAGQTVVYLTSINNCTSLASGVYVLGYGTQHLKASPSGPVTFVLTCSDSKDTKHRPQDCSTVANSTPVKWSTTVGPAPYTVDGYQSSTRFGNEAVAFAIDAGVPTQTLTNLNLVGDVFEPGDAYAPGPILTLTSVTVTGHVVAGEVRAGKGTPSLTVIAPGTIVNGPPHLIG